MASRDPDRVADEIRPPPSRLPEGEGALRTPEDEGERRPVTVVFADISGFTALSETRDPEEVAVLIDRCLREMANAVYQYEGTVDKYIGDAVMALFGAPTAHEDDPERAIRAAFEMRDRVAAISAELQPGPSPAPQPSPVKGEGEPAPLGEPLLALHVGVNTGVVVAGRVGADQRRDYTVLGDAVNVASRLEGAATRGDVVVGESTYRLARHAIAFEPLGEVKVKGKAEPLLAYRAIAVLAQPESGRGLEHLALSAPLVGRDTELSELLAASERARQGRAQVVSLVGEAGEGKSRLIRELLDQLQPEIEPGHVVVQRAACLSLGQPAYGVLADLSRDAFGIARGDPAEIIRQKIETGLADLGLTADQIAHTAPLLGRVLEANYDDARFRYLEPEQLKRQLFLAMGNMLDLRMQRQALLLIVEDLHWSDAASAELLRFLLDRLNDRPLLLVVSHRPSFDPTVLAESRADYTSIRLRPISQEASRVLLDSYFAPDPNPIPPKLREAILSQAGGIPLYLEEVLRDLVQSGAIAREHGRWVSRGDASTVEIPPTIHGVLLARIDRLPAGARRLLQEASVLGLTFSEPLLRAVSSEPESQVAHLETLKGWELLDELPGAAESQLEATHRFVNALGREVTYEGLLLRRRTELHQQAGDALERICAGRPERLEDLEQLGRHFSLSTEKVKGARYLTSAGDWAHSIYANQDAAGYYGRALDALESASPEVGALALVPLHERMADALAAAGTREQALPHYTGALEMLAMDGSAATRARLRRKIGGLHWLAGDRSATLSEYRQGLALLDGQPPEIERAHLYQEMGRFAFRTGDNEGAIHWASEALALGTQLLAEATEAETRREAAEALAHAHNTLGVALARGGRDEEGVAEIERGAAFAQEHDLPQVACRAFTNLGVLYSTLDPGKAIETSLAGLELAKRIGDLTSQSWLYANLAGAYCTFTGQCEEEGIGAAQAAIDLDRQLGHIDHLAVPLVVLGQIYQCHGDPEIARQCYEEALPLAQEMGEPQLLFPCYDGLATLHLEMDDEALAEMYMQKSVDVCEQAGLAPDTLVVLPFLC